MINVLSLFDGLGGAKIALDRLNIPCNYYSSEIDKYAIKVAMKNYPDIIQLGNITNIKYMYHSTYVKSGTLCHSFGTNQLPQVDLLIGGSPCTDLSISKKNRQGLKGEQSGLFYEYVRLLKETKPKYFLLENVKSMSKESKQTITDILGVEAVLINSSLLTAQNRKRLYWFGKLVNGKYEKVEVKQPEDKNIYLKDILEKKVDEQFFIKNANELTWITDPTRLKKKYCQIDGEKSLTLLARTYANWNSPDKTVRIGKIGKGGQGDRIYSIEGKSVNLSANGGGRGAKTGLYCVAQRGRYNKDGSTSQKLEPRYDGKTNSLTSVQKDNAIFKIDKIKPYIRKLTPLECERLQGLKDNYTEGVSNSQRYRMIGNGFTVPIIEHILSFAKF